MSTKITRSTPVGELPLTLPVAEAGQYFFGFNRGQSYRAAKTGALVTVRIGENRLMVSVPATLRKIQTGD
jgi:hypothetical protein